MSSRQVLRRIVAPLVIIVVTVGLPYVLNSYTVHVADVAIIFALLAIGLYLTMGVGGQIDMAQIAFFGVGAYVSGILSLHAHFNFWTGGIAGIVAAVLVAIVFGLPALRVQSHYLALVTLGLAIAFSSLVTNLKIAGSASGLSGLPVANLFGYPLASDFVFFYLEAVVLIASIAFASFIVRTQLGRRMRAMRDDPLAAASVGVRVPVLRLLAFAFGGFFGGLAGALYAGGIRFVAPETFTLTEMFLLLAMVVIGGRYSIWGSVIGAVGLVIVREIFSDFATYAQLAYGALVVLVVVFAPTGVAGIPERIRAARRRAREGDATVGVRAYQPVGVDVRPDDASSAAVVLRVGDVVKVFKGLRALDGVSMEVRAGEIHGIVGPNGSGKTTLFNLLSGINRPTSGRIELFGSSTARKSADALSQAGLARTFQNLRLFKRLSVRENVVVAADRTRTSWSWRYLLWPIAVSRAERALGARADELLERYGLDAHAGALPGALSYGAQRRVEIARAMATGPRILLLDEPAAGLNGDEVNQLSAIVRDVRAEGVTVVIIEHNMGLMMSLCDRVTVLATGRVIADGTPAEVVAVPEVIEAYLGDDARIDQAELEEAIVESTEGEA